MRWADEERALLAALDDNTRMVLEHWRARARPGRAEWRRVLRTEHLGPYTPPGQVAAVVEPTPMLVRYVRDLVRGDGPSLLLSRAGRAAPRVPGAAHTRTE